MDDVVELKPEETIGHFVVAESGEEVNIPITEKQLETLIMRIMEEFKFEPKDSFTFDKLKHNIVQSFWNFGKLNEWEKFGSVHFVDGNFEICWIGICFMRL